MLLPGRSQCLFQEALNAEVYLLRRAGMLLRFELLDGTERTCATSPQNFLFPERTGAVKAFQLCARQSARNYRFDSKSR
jgi:hypothetical protein